MKRLHKQNGKRMVELLMHVPFLSHMSRNKLTLLGELFSFARFDKKDLVCYQVSLKIRVF